MPASVPAPVRVDRTPAAAPSSFVPPRGPTPLPLRLLRGLVLAALAAGAVTIGRRTGLLDGGVGLVLATVLVLAVPTSRDLARRVLLAGCLLLGWTQVLWWWALPVGDVGRVTLGMLGLAAGVGAWVGTAPRPGERARRLLPRLRPVDAVLPATMAFGALLLRPWLTATSSTQTLGVLMGGWDNVAHFAMVHTIRRVGRTVDLVGPRGADDATWQFLGYPEGFHAVAATVVEVLIGPSGTGIDAELPAYARALALVVIAATTVVVAGLCALPALRRRGWLAVPSAAFVAAVFFLGPGALAVNGGIGNFAVACALAVAVVLLVVPGGRVVAPLTLAAVGGAVVGIASSWVLMLALALPALPLLLLPLRRRRWAASEPHAALSIVLVLLVVAALARTALVLTKVQAASPLTIDGGRVPIDLGVTVAAALCTVAACVLVLGHGARPAIRTRVGALAAVPVGAAAVAAALAVLQIRANGEVTYYGLKFLLGAEIVLLCVVVVPLVHLVDHRRRGPRPGGGALSTAAGSVLGALALTQVFGLSVSRLADVGLGAEAQGARNAVHQLQVIADPPAAADLAARITRTAWRPPPSGAYYLDVPSDRRVSPILVAQWFLALTDTWTSAANTVAAGTVVDGLPQVSALARRLLVEHPAGVVVVRPEYVDPVRRALDDPQLGARVVGL